jgi:glycosyltransferase involved in cell wall biosynthesis
MLGPTVHILLATFNGALFLEEQLNSIAAQSHSKWTLTVSDDGSTDATLRIVSNFSKRVTQPVQVIKGPGLGSTQNFFYLLQQVTPTDSNDLFAFCDQDDVWHTEKLALAIKWHVGQDQQMPYLYCSKTQYVDEFLRPLGESPGLHRPACFSNALVQNIASGNTMVINRLALEGMKKIKPENSVWHDWTAYLVVTAMGGMVEFDNTPSLMYRQHNANVVGSNQGLYAQLRRLGPVWLGRYKYWIDTNLDAMHDIENLLSNEAKKCIADLERMRTASGRWERIRLFSRSKIRRQGGLSNLSLLAALVSKKI